MEDIKIIHFRKYKKIISGIRIYLDQSWDKVGFQTMFFHINSLFASLLQAWFCVP